MFESNLIEFFLKEEAERISKELNDAPIIIIAGGTGKNTNKGKLNSCMTGSSMHDGYRMRDLLGVLQSSTQISSLKHLLPQILPQMMKSLLPDILKKMGLIQEKPHEEGRD